MQIYEIPNFSSYQSRCIVAGRAPQFLGKAEKKSLSRKRTAASHKQTLIQLHLPRVIRLFCLIGFLLPSDTTHTGDFEGQTNRSRVNWKALGLQETLHMHTQGLNIMKHQQYLGFQHQPTLAAHKPLFAAACMAASSNSCPLEEPDVNVGGEGDFGRNC